MAMQAGRSGWRAIIPRARFRPPTAVAAKRRCNARVRRTVLPGLLVAGTVAFCTAAVAAPSATPSPSPSPTSASPTPEPSSSSPSSSPTPSPTSPAPTPSKTSPAPTPSPTSPTPTPSPTSPRPTPSPTSPKPSPAPTSAPAPAPIPTSFAAHTPHHAHVKKGHRVTAAVKAPATSDASPGAFTPVASIGAGRPQPDGTGPAVVATFAALLAGLALVTGRWLRLSRRRRAHPPRHAFRTPMPSGGHRRPRGTGDDWDF